MYLFSLNDCTSRVTSVINIWLQFVDRFFDRHLLPTKFLMNFSLLRSTSQNVRAKAIYDNIAESTDELAFRKGETLEIIEQNTDGLDGWWLCSLRGRKGLCPGNRLKIIDYESNYSPASPLASPCSTSMSMSMISSQNTQPNELYENTSNNSIKGKRRSWHIMPNKVSISVGISLKLLPIFCDHSKFNPRHLILIIKFKSKNFIEWNFFCFCFFLFQFNNFLTNESNSFCLTYR